MLCLELSKIIDDSPCLRSYISNALINYIFYSVKPGFIVYIFFVLDCKQFLKKENIMEVESNCFSSAFDNNCSVSQKQYLSD
jgi:hypothetical protein